MKILRSAIHHFFYRQGNTHYVGGYSPRGNIVFWLLFILFITGVASAIAGLIHILL